MNEKELKKRLISKRKSVKNKLDLLKHGEMVQERKFDPITKHLKNIEGKLDVSQNILNNEYRVKKEGEEEEGREHSSKIYKVPKRESIKKSSSLLLKPPPRKTTKKSHSSVSSSNLEGEDDSDDISFSKRTIIEDIKSEDSESDTAISPRLSDVDLEEKSYTDYLEQYEPLPRKYIHLIHKADKRGLDGKYGVRHDPKTEKLHIGDSRIDIVDSDVIVKNKRYKGTEGLYELLFKNDPQMYTEEDVKNYKQIVVKTNANRRYYQPDKQILGSKGGKYKKIISTFSTVSGEGMQMELTDNKVDYVHWDDPNELVDRLRLLLSSQSAGNTSHINEINSIVEELKEAHIIA